MKETRDNSVNRDSLSRNRMETSSVWMEFTDDVSKKPNMLFLFFEGDDDARYYMPRVEKYSGFNYTEVIQYRCNGKETVLNLNEIILSNLKYASIKKAFFVDRDFCPCIDKNDLYQTCCHSIENYYCSKKAFENILLKIFFIPSKSKDFNKLLEDFIKRQKEFHEKVLILNSWFIFQDEKCQRDGVKRTVCYDSFKVGSYFAIKIDSLDNNKEIDLGRIQNIFEKYYDVDERLYKIIEDVRSKEKYHLFYGKYEMDFMLNLLCDLREKIQKKDKYFSSGFKKIKLDPKTDPYLVFSDCADTPEDLELFLRSYGRTGQP